jgi:hypothetical protein
MTKITKTRKVTAIRTSTMPISRRTRNAPT